VEESETHKVYKNLRKERMINLEKSQTFQRGGTRGGNGGGSKQVLARAAIAGKRGGGKLESSLPMRVKSVQV